jgi:hypothetical protein
MEADQKAATPGMEADRKAGTEGDRKAAEGKDKEDDDAGG